MIKVALLECKSGAIATQIGFLLLLFFAHFPHKHSNQLLSMLKSKCFDHYF